MYAGVHPSVASYELIYPIYTKHSLYYSSSRWCRITIFICRVYWWSNYWYHEATWRLYRSFCLSWYSCLRWRYYIIGSSVGALQRLVSLCEVNLQSLELTINIKKSICTIIGPRFNAPCTIIVTSDGSALNGLTVYVTSVSSLCDHETSSVHYIMESNHFSVHSMRFMVK